MDSEFDDFVHTKRNLGGRVHNGHRDNVIDSPEWRRFCCSRRKTYVQKSIGPSCLFHVCGECSEQNAILCQFSFIGLPPSRISIASAIRFFARVSDSFVHLFTLERAFYCPSTVNIWTRTLNPCKCEIADGFVSIRQWSRFTHVCFISFCSLDCIRCEENDIVALHSLNIYFVYIQFSVARPQHSLCEHVCYGNIASDRFCFAFCCCFVVHSQSVEIYIYLRRLTGHKNIT